MLLMAKVAETHRKQFQRGKRAWKSQDATQPHTAFPMAASLQTLSVSMVTIAAMERGGCGKMGWVGSRWSGEVRERHLLDCDILTNGLSRQAVMKTLSALHCLLQRVCV